MKCHYCDDSFFVNHHIDYKNDETIPLCKRCHYCAHSILKDFKTISKRGYLCHFCGRHITSHRSKLCWLCRNPQSRKIDCFGLMGHVKRKPLYRFNYHWPGVHWG